MNLKKWFSLTSFDERELKVGKNSPSILAMGLSATLDTLNIHNDMDKLVTLYNNSATNIHEAINHYYGDYKCSCCQETPLVGKNYSLCEEHDDEGYFWRSFCPDCIPTINDMIASGKSIAEVYRSFSPSPLA